MIRTEFHALANKLREQLDVDGSGEILASGDEAAMVIAALEVIGDTESKKANAESEQQASFAVGNGTVTYTVDVDADEENGNGIELSVGDLAVTWTVNGSGELSVQAWEMDGLVEKNHLYGCSVRPAGDISENE